MKSSKKLRSAITIIICIIWTIQSSVNAQSQSLFLPFSGDTDPATGSKMFNFINPLNTIITTLPKNVFFIGGDQGDPHDEGDLPLHANTTRRAG